MLKIFLLTFLHGGLTRGLSTLQPIEVTYTLSSHIASLIPHLMSYQLTSSCSLLALHLKSVRHSYTPPAFNKDSLKRVDKLHTLSHETMAVACDAREVKGDPTAQEVVRYHCSKEGYRRESSLYMLHAHYTSYLTLSVLLSQWSGCRLLSLYPV